MAFAYMTTPGEKRAQREWPGLGWGASSRGLSFQKSREAARTVPGSSGGSSEEGVGVRREGACRGVPVGHTQSWEGTHPSARQRCSV